MWGWVGVAFSIFNSARQRFGQEKKMKVGLFYHSRQLVLTLTCIMTYVHRPTYHLELLGEEEEEGRRTEGNACLGSGKSRVLPS